MELCCCYVQQTKPFTSTVHNSVARFVYIVILFKIVISYCIVQCTVFNSPCCWFQRLPTDGSSGLLPQVVSIPKLIHLTFSLSLLAYCTLLLFSSPFPSLLPLHSSTAHFTPLGHLITVKLIVIILKCSFRSVKGLNRLFLLEKIGRFSRLLTLRSNVLKLNYFNDKLFQQT